MPDISVYDSVAIGEVFGDGSIYNGEDITVLENIFLQFSDDFSQFLRGFPYNEATKSGVKIVDLGSGYTQRVDLQGVLKKTFSIRFPVFTKDEVKAVRDYFEARYNQQFYFTEPNWGVTYLVEIDGDSWSFERQAFNTYFAGFNLVEVL